LETYYHANPGLIQRSAIALGFFDGVHPGHQVVIGSAVAEAKKQNLVAAVLTFKDHPRTLIQGSSPLLLTVIEQRLALFQKLGVEAALVLTFTEELCRLSPQEYVKNILIDSMGARLISVGFNHHFGRDREGDPALLAALGKTMGFSVSVSPPVFIDGLEVSSSKIREALVNGEIELANKLLSRPYAVGGEVIAGAKRGREIGFPTANLMAEEFQVLPKNGVYAGQARLGRNGPVPAVINVGLRPTFPQSPSQRKAEEQPAAKPLVEIHIFDFDEDIYGQELEVSFYKYLRAERKFDSAGSLKAQILLDCKQSKNYFQEQGQKAGSAAEPNQKMPA
jgi:riboflavin kinase/FMN adenylyltransferase